MAFPSHIIETLLKLTCWTTCFMVVIFIQWTSKRTLKVIQYQNLIKHVFQGLLDQLADNMSVLTINHTDNYKAA